MSRKMARQQEVVLRLKQLGLTVGAGRLGFG
jgi:hypothetical protein